MQCTLVNNVLAGKAHALEFWISSYLAQIFLPSCYFKRLGHVKSVGFAGGKCASETP